MKTIALISRVGLGLAFLVFGLNGFLGFIPMQSPGGAAGAFMGGLAQSVYFFPLLKGTETIIGLLLLAGVLVPLALVVITPVMLNILLFHLFLEPAGIGVPVVLLVFHVILTVSNWEAYKHFFSCKNAWAK